MPRIAVISHKFDKFERRSYLLANILKEVEPAGITAEITHGPRRFVEADLAILHVDSTVIEPEYIALARRYPRTINLPIRNIGKSRTSGASLTRGENWSGPVIIKTELNGRGAPEFYHNQVAALRGKPAPHPAVTGLRDYVVLDRASDVPDPAWRDPSVAVEKFLPERDPRGFALRTWVFMGGRETCSRCVSAEPIVKGADVFSRELVPVPDELREVRGRLGFDYGKFDFVVHDGKPVLFDANMTPTVPENLSDDLRQSAKELARGLLELL
ncbi:MAG TPA: hypothetical protein VGF43_14355 [Dongiaceae bacterium]